MANSPLKRKPRNDALGTICPYCGQKISSKINRDKRDIEIYKFYKNGYQLKFIMDKFNLSRSAIIRAIYRGEKLQYKTTNQFMQNCKAVQEHEF